MRSEQELASAIDRHADTVRRLCLLYLKNQADTEDIFQTVFLKYALRSAAFENEAHEKAWFIRVTINACKDVLKSFFYTKTTSLDEALHLTAPVCGEYREILEAVLCLPRKYRDVIYLHDYEGYSAREVGKILRKNTNTVYTHLNRGRALLREALKKEGYHG